MLGCLNKKVLIGLGVAALAVVALAPDLRGAALPVLLIAACPLSMVLMMGAMGGARRAGVESPDQAGSAVPDDARLRELEEEVSRLKAARQTGGLDRSDA